MLYRVLNFVCVTGYAMGALHVGTALLFRPVQPIIGKGWKDYLLESLFVTTPIYAVLCTLIPCLVAALMRNSGVKGNWAKLWLLSFWGIPFSVFCVFLASWIGGTR
jgi:hypothetical protein